jgi:hypothetical protein
VLQVLSRVFSHLTSLIEADPSGNLIELFQLAAG